MRVLITGVTGFVGEHVARELEGAGHDVAGTWFGDPPTGDPRPSYAVDLTRPEEIRLAVSEFSPDAIVHLAGASHVGSSWKEMGYYHRVNVLGTENVLDAAVGVRVVLASSSEVYGPVPEAEQPIPEDREPDPSNPYALTKAAAERLVLRSGGVVARLFNLVGPGQSEIFALPTFARQLRSIEAGTSPPELRVGNLEARRDFVHVLDGAAALARLAEAGRPESVYQVATGEAHSIGDVLARLLRVSGLEVDVVVDPERLRPNDIPLLVGRSDRLAELGWAPRRSVDDAVRDLWESLGASGAQSPD